MSIDSEVDKKILSEDVPTSEDEENSGPYVPTSPIKSYLPNSGVRRRRTYEPGSGIPKELDGI